MLNCMLCMFSRQATISKIFFTLFKAKIFTERNAFHYLSLYPNTIKALKVNDFQCFLFRLFCA